MVVSENIKMVYSTELCAPRFAACSHSQEIGVSIVRNKCRTEFATKLKLLTPDTQTYVLTIIIIKKGWQWKAG